MTLLALLALLAGALVWAAPGSEAQTNQAPVASAAVDDGDNAGTPPTYNPSRADGGDANVTVNLDGEGSFDVDDGDNSELCADCKYKWEIETGPYDWIAISNSTSAGDATFVMPTEAFVDTLSDDDPQKHVIGVRLTVTDAEGATDSDTLDIVINQRPVADIQVFAGLLDRTLLDLDASTKERYNIAAVIDGPGENGNRDNEWDVMEGAYLQLDGSASTDENPSTGLPASYSWSRTLIRPADADGYNDATFENTGQRLDVGATAEAIDLNDDEDTTDAGESVMVLPKDVDPGSPVTLFYTLTVTDARGRTGSSIVRIVVNDTSVTPDVSIELGNRLSAGIPGRGLSDSSIAQKDTPPQPTVGQFTGVENQFLVAAGSTVQLAATVKVNNMVQTTGYSYRWTGAVQVAATDSDATLAVNEPAEARIRVPANAADGDTIDVSVTVTDSARRSSVTTPIQLLVGKNTPPTADGVDANNADKDAPPMPSLLVHSVTDGFQSEEDGSTVTLRGVGNDADGDSIITAWTLREAPDPDAFNAAVAAWVENGTALPAEQQRALLDLREPKEPLFELSGALTDTVSFEVPNLENGESKGTFLVFTVVDSNGAFDAQLVYVHIKADDDVPNADAGADQQVEPGSFVRLNGSASSDPDTGDDISHRWEYVGAEMDPLPGARSPLSQAEIDELDGWILDKDGSTAGGTIDYIVGDNFILKQGESSNNLKSTTSAYPYFDAPELTGFNNIKLTFRLTVADGEDLNSDGDEEDSVSNVVESVVDIDVNRDGDKDDTFLGFIERFAGNFDTDTVTITVVNRFYSGSIPGPDFCTNRSLGGPQTFAFDSDKDGVADTCALNTTRRATVARQNALETLAALNRSEFNAAVLAVCAGSEFKQADYGDDPGDLDGDVCETERPSPPPAAADPATAETYFSGTVTGPDFCTNFSLGGARSYANDSDGDGVADQCSLATTRREAIARQRALGDFMVDPLTDEQSGTLTAILRLFALNNGYAGRDTDQQNEHNMLAKAHAGRASDASAAVLTADEVITAETTSTSLQTTQRNAERWANTLAAACRALGSQDFGDAPSALARDACSPSPATGQPLS